MTARWAVRAAATKARSSRRESSPTTGTIKMQMAYAICIFILIERKGLESAVQAKCPVDTLPARGFSAEKKSHHRHQNNRDGFRHPYYF